MREGIGTFIAWTAVGWQPTEVTGMDEGRDWHFHSLDGCRLATYRGYRGLRREGTGTFQARATVGGQPAEVTHFQS